MSCALNLSNHQPAVDTYFDSAAPQWRELYRESGLRATIFSYRQFLSLTWLAQSGPLKDAKVLDVGCGAGPASVALAQRGARVKAIDTVLRMISLTEQSAREAGVRDLVDATLGDVHCLRSADNSFDAVVAIGVVYWLHSPERALREVFRVLKPGGHLVVSADNALRLTYRLDPAHLSWVLAFRRTLARALRSLGWIKPSSCIPVNTYSALQFDELLANSGFQKLRGATIGFGPFSLLRCTLLPDFIGLRLHRILQRLAERNHPLLSTGGNHYLVLARKPL